MKKAFVIIGIFIIFFLFYFLQTNFFNWFTIAGVMPNLFIILVLFTGLYIGRTGGALIGAACGIIIDLFIGKNIGITGIMLAIVGLIGGYFDKNFSKDSKITIILMVIGVTVIYEFGKYIINVLMFHFEFEGLVFLRILAIEIGYQFILTIILYPIIRKVGYIVEDVFKGNNIMTRYF